MKIQVLLILFLLIPLASALEIEELQFLEFESWGKPISAVRTTGVVPNIDLKIVISGEDFTRLNVDLSELNRNSERVQELGYKDMNVQSSQCEKENSTYTCYIRYIELLLASDTVTMPFKLYNSTDNVDVVKTYVFDIDDTLPEITFIGTENCIEDQCYIASDVRIPIVMKFQDSKATFEKKFVHYRIGSKNSRAYECDGMTCTGYEEITCASGQYIALKILPADTMDDAYNKVSNTIRSDLICDADSPEVTGHLTESTDGDVLKVGDTMIVTVNITDSIGPILVQGNFTDFGGEDNSSGTCTEEDGYWSCELSTIIFGSDPYTGTVELLVQDFAGNKVKYTFDQEIAGISNETEPNFWRMDYDFAPEDINKQTMAYVSKKLYVHSTLVSRVSNVELLKLDVAKCEGNGTQYLVPGGPKLFNSEANNKNPVLVFEFRQTTVPDQEKKVFFNCTLNLQSSKKTSKGTYYVRTPETEVVEIEVDFVNLKSVDTQIKEEIQKLEDKALEWDQTIGPYRNYMYQAYQLCNGLNLMNGLSGGLAGSASIMHAIPPAKPAAVSVGKSATILGEISEETKKTGIGQACDFLTCKAEYQQEITNLMGELPGVEEASKALGYNDYSQFVNPDNSLIMSAITMCLPSMVYNMQKLKAIDCEYITCLKRDALGGGFPVAECGKVKSYNTCKFAVGEVFSVIPYTALLDDGVDFVKSVVSNPVSLFGAALTSVCRYTSPSSGSLIESTCNVAASVGKVTNFLNSFRGVAGKMEQYQQPISVCDNVLNNRGVFIPEVYTPEGLPEEFGCRGYGCAYNVGSDENPNVYEAITTQSGEPVYYHNGHKLVSPDPASYEGGTNNDNYQEDLAEWILFEDKFKYQIDKNKNEWNEKYEIKFFNEQGENADLFADYGVMSEELNNLKLDYQDSMNLYNQYNSDDDWEEYFFGIGINEITMTPEDYEKVKADMDTAEITMNVEKKVMTDGTQYYFTREEIKRIQGELETYVEGKKDVYEELKDERDDLLRNMEYQAYWQQGGWAGWMTAMSSMRGFNSMS
ncbi:hypothetical protein ACFLTH_12630, partial [Bacteroidota bacterium]